MRIKRFLPIILLIALVGIIYFSYVELLSPIETFLKRTPRPIRQYSQATVHEICNSVIPIKDPFCDSVRNESQSVKTVLMFKDALYRNYPVGETQFDTIMAIFQKFPSENSFEDSTQFSLRGCQLPTNSSKPFECVIDFHNETGLITIKFDYKGMVIDYHITGEMGEGT